MLQEAANELLRRQAHDALLAGAGVVAHPEGHHAAGHAALQPPLFTRLCQAVDELAAKHLRQRLDRKQEAAPAGDPLLLGARLATRTVAVAARVVDVPGRAAGVAAVDMPAQRRRAAGDDGAPCLGLRTGERMRGKVVLPVRREDIGQLQPAWRRHPLPGRDAGLPQQVQRRSRRRQPRLLQVKVTGRGGDIGMPQQALDGRQVHAGFEQVGGKRVAPIPMSE